MPSAAPPLKPAAPADVAALASRILTVILPPCRGPEAPAARALPPCTRLGIRPLARRTHCGLALRARQLRGARSERTPAAPHRPLALPTRQPSPRLHPSVQESTVRDEKRNADQCFAARGMPDRHC